MSPSGVHPIIASSDCSTMDARNSFASPAICSAGLAKVGKERSNGFSGTGLLLNLVLADLAHYCHAALLYALTQVASESKKDGLKGGFLGLRRDVRAKSRHAERGHGHLWFGIAVNQQ